MRTPHIIVLILIGLAVGAVDYYRIGKQANQHSETISLVSTATSAPQLASAGNTRASTTPKILKTEHTSPSTFIAPDLNRPVVARITLSSSVEEDARKNIALLTAALRKTPDEYTAWVALGMYRKTLGDYEGAKEVWEYVIKRWPTDYIAYNNLGNLFRDELRDYPHAEAMYLKTVVLRPDFIQTYSNLYEMYRYLYKEKEAHASEALLLGLKKNPADMNLMLTLARYYAETQQKASAATYYKMAIQRAETGNKPALADSLRKEALASGIAI